MTRSQRQNQRGSSISISVLLAVCFGLVVSARTTDALPVHDDFPGAWVKATNQKTIAFPIVYGSHHVVSWQARTNGAGGEFRLYHGEDPATLQLAAVKQACFGKSDYQVSAPTPSGPPAYFELRYITQEGTEVLLVSAHIFQDRFQSRPEAQAEPGRGGVDAVLYRPWCALQSTETWHSRAIRAERQMPGPEPETPPPRRTR